MYLYPYYSGTEIYFFKSAVFILWGYFVLYIRPHTPLPSFGYSSNPGTFSLHVSDTPSPSPPYRYGSFPPHNPHSIKSAALPVTNGVAKGCSCKCRISSAHCCCHNFHSGATRSGFTIFVSLVNPLPEKSAYANVPCVICSYGYCNGWQKMEL